MRSCSYEKLLTTILKQGMAEGAFKKRDARLAAYAILGMGTEVATWFNPAGRLKLVTIQKAYAEMATEMMEGR